MRRLIQCFSAVLAITGLPVVGAANDRHPPVTDVSLKWQQLQGVFGPWQLPSAIGSSVPLLDALIGLRFVGVAPYYARLPGRAAPALITRSTRCPGCPACSSGDGPRIEAPPGRTLGRFATEFACVDARARAQLRPRSCTFRWVGRTPDGRALPAYSVRYTAPADAGAQQQPQRLSNTTALLQRDSYPYIEQANSISTQDIKPADGRGESVDIIFYRPFS